MKKHEDLRTHTLKCAKMRRQHTIKCEITRLGAMLRPHPFDTCGLTCVFEDAMPDTFLVMLLSLASA
jgi:hypothetical protein